MKDEFGKWYRSEIIYPYSENVARRIRGDIENFIKNECFGGKILDEKEVNELLGKSKRSYLE